MDLDELTLPEAQAEAARVRQLLVEAHIEPFSIGTANADHFSVLESYPPQYRAFGVHVIVDLAPADPAMAQIGRHDVTKLSAWSSVNWIYLVAGLIKWIPDSWRARIVYWGWDAPTLWVAQRFQWRTGSTASVNALALDKLRRQASKFHILKRKWDAVTKAVAAEDDPPRKALKTDAELLATRNTRETTRNRGYESDG
jgi:hypothetical protein